MPLHTAWTAAPLLLLIAALGLKVSWLRLSGVARRDEALFGRWQRAHGNAVEHVPLCLVGLLLLELCGGRAGALIAAGAGLVAARLLHGLGTALRLRRAKFVGAGLTYTVEVALGALLIAQLA